MLWTDRQFVTVQDLTTLDSEFVDVAEAEGILVTGRDCLISRALEEAGEELRKTMVAFGGFMGSGDLSVNHMWAVLNVATGATVKQRAHLYQVVVDGDNPNTWSHIKRWAAFWCMHAFYRDAFNRTVKDRYEGKMRFYKSEIQRRLDASIQSLGIPIVRIPLFAPAARFGRDPGTWSDDNLSTVSANGTTGGSYDVVVTYVDMSNAALYVSPDDANNSESAPSEIANIEVEADQGIQVSISTLVPPTGVQHRSDQIVYSANLLKATHWNVYVGHRSRTMYLQNQSPIDIATKTYTLTTDPVSSGYAVGTGQYSDKVFTVTKMRQRG